jgi:hypothetical protein
MLRFQVSICVCAALFFAGSVAFAQQTVVIDWPARQPTSPPITVDKTTQVVVSVRNVNDMLYSYSERVVAHPRIVPETQFPVLPGAELKDATDPCKPLIDALNNLDTAFNKPELKPDVGNAEIPKSFTLEATKSAYDSIKSLIPALDAAVGSCKDPDLAPLAKRKNDYQTKIKPDWDAAEGKSHVFEFSTTLEPLTDYSIYIREKYVHTDANHNTIDKTTDACTAKDANGKLTGVECEIVYQPRSTTITASGGFLITGMPSPTYARQNVPNSTNAVLVVNNTGPVRTAFTALINVKLPLPGKWGGKVCPDDDSVFGCAISVGPAFQLSSTQQATRIGLFAGVGFHLWRYLYVTPGVHIGQYDNFPAGFTAAGQPIPPTFTGNLQPIPNTTVRFALALSFKGWDLLHKNTTSQGTTKNGSATNPVTK